MTTPNDTTPHAGPVKQPPPTVPESNILGACGNCYSPLLGPHCYACGQPIKGLVRHFSSIIGDALDTIFDFDTRIVRTIGPLLVKPGHITREYFDGRRVRYVSPVRLFFSLCIVLFFVAQLSFDGSDLNIHNDNNGIASAATVQEAESQRDAALAAIKEARKKAENTPGAMGVELGEEVIRSTAQSRIKVLREAEAKGLPPPKPDNNGISIGKDTWDAKTNRINVGWLPRFANNWLNIQAGRANSNIARLNDDPSAFKDSVLGAVPTTLFVLVPVFALMLKLAYVFKRRLYMEHVVMALHSHAFLCLDLLLVLLVRALAQWLVPGEGALATLFGWIEWLLLAWIPIYLLVMQKRVYAQGWPMTLLKYFVLGTCYTVLLSFAIVAAAAIGLVAM